MRDRGGVGAVGARDDGNFETFAPELELFDGGGAKRVASGQEGRLTARLDQVRQLGGGGGFARAVDADDGNDGQSIGLPAQIGPGGRPAFR